jgi:hypothetical protein
MPADIALMGPQKKKRLNAVQLRANLTLPVSAGQLTHTFTDPTSAHIWGSCMIQASPPLCMLIDSHKIQ